MADGVLERLDHDGEAQQAQRTQERQQDDGQFPEVPEEPMAARLGKPQPGDVIDNEYAVDSEQGDTDRLAGAPLRFDQDADGVQTEKRECDGHEGHSVRCS